MRNKAMYKLSMISKITIEIGKGTMQVQKVQKV